jgi:phospholipid/cholesterol/gamma-HCH transport system permease protein
VPQVTTKAVVNSVIYVVLFNLTMTILFYLSRLMALGVLP